MNKLYLKNIIKNDKSLLNLSRNTLLKIINLLPTYTDKTIIELIDLEIKKIEDNELIEISNIRINDIRLEINKTKFKSIYNKENYTIYEYEHYSDVYFNLMVIDIKKSIQEILNENLIKNSNILYISSRTIKKPHVININNKESMDTLIQEIISKLIKVKKIETLRLRFYYNVEYAPLITTKQKNKKEYPTL